MRSSRTAACFAACLAVAPAIAMSAPTPAPEPTAPLVRKLIAPKVVVARQGHARFLVSVKTRTEARVIVRVLSSKGKVVNTVKTPGQHASGRAWLLVNATNAAGYQLPAGRYSLQVYAVNAAKKASNVITQPLRLNLRAPRGTLQVYTVPAWPSMIAGVAQAPGGQIAVSVPGGGAPAAGGLTAGDVIRVVNGRDVSSRGAWFAAMRELPANTPVPVEIDRAGVRQTLTMTLPPDWTVQPKHQASIAAASAASPQVVAFRYAAVRERLDAGDTAGAKAAWDTLWPAASRTSAPGEMLSGALLATDGDHLNAIGSYNRALAADPTIAAAQFGRGLALTARGRNDRAIEAFTLATTIDPTDGVSQTFRAFALLRSDLFPDALVAADAALARDRRYDEARIARGIALIGLRRTRDGVQELRLGLSLVSNAARAQAIIVNNLEPNAQ